MFISIRDIYTELVLVKGHDFGDFLEKPPGKESGQ